VLNQSDATADQYTLEITIREDLDGNGWTNGMEDSLRLDTTFASGSFNDTWVLLSAPLSSFANLFTGGDGTFNGNLDEIVVVISGVQGAGGATVEVDFDLITFTSGGPLAFSEVVFDDMEHGDPFGNGWFAFVGSVGGGGIGPNSGDLPPAQGGALSLETGWGSGGTPGFFGGFGRTNLVDLSGTTHFNFWINPDAGQDYTLEINLQDDDDGDGGIASPADDEFQYNCAISPIGPCAVAGDGWQLVSIPLDDFFDDNSFLTGGNGALDPVSALRGGNGGLVNVVLAVISNSGADVTLRTDYWAFTEGPAVARRIIDDFESGLPGGSDGDGVPIGFFTFQDGASSVAISTSSTPPAPALPAVGTPNSVLQVDVDVTAFAGVIHSFENTALDTWIPQDWSAFEGISFWLYGNNSGTDLFVDLLENRNPGSTTDDAERWTVSFVDDFSGWRLFELPFADFARKEIGNGAPNDGLSLFEVHGWTFGTLGSGGPQTYYIDEVSLYGIVAVEVPELAVSFALGNFEVPEGSAADITVKLNRQLGPGDPAEVSVDYATEPGTATPERDYTPTAGTLTFVNGGPSELTFPLEALDDSKYEGDEHVILRLSNLVDVAPGSAQQASAQIVDDDPFDPDLLDDFERGAYLWDASGGLTLETPEIAATDPLAVPGQGAFERILEVGTPILVKTIIGGNLCHSQGVVPVAILTTDHFDATTVDHTTVRFGNASEAHVRRQTGQPQRHEEDFDGDADIDLVFHFRVSDTGYDCDTTNTTLTGSTSAGLQIVAGGEAGLERDFAIGQDWTRGEALRFWFYGTDSGDAIVLQVKDNRAPGAMPRCSTTPTTRPMRPPTAQGIS
jgi:hypothetical protein